MGKYPLMTTGYNVIAPLIGPGWRALQSGGRRQIKKNICLVSPVPGLFSTERLTIPKSASISTPLKNKFSFMTRQKVDFLVVFIGHFHAFHVGFVPLEYVPTIP